MSSSARLKRARMWSPSGITPCQIWERSLLMSVESGLQIQCCLRMSRTCSFCRYLSLFLCSSCCSISGRSVGLRPAPATMSMVISVLHSSSVSVLSLMKSPSGIAVSGPVNWDQKMNPSKILAQLGQFPLTLSHPLITPQLQLETCPHPPSKVSALKRNSFTF